jgi:signal peptidase II
LIRAWSLILIIAAAVVAIDQITKNWALDALGSGRIIHVAGSLQLDLVRNPGVAFGVGAGVAPILIGVAIVGFVLVLLGKQIRLQGAALWAVGLVLGGAVSNVFDRLFRGNGGTVIDFVDLRWWPVFNVADACIVVGAIALVVWGSKKREENS